jgi:hypothetical protein
VEDLIGELHVDPNVVSQVTKVYTEFLEVPTRGWETCESPPDPTTIISVTKKIQEEKNQALPEVQIGLNEKKDKHSHQLQYIHEKLYINMPNVDLLKHHTETESPYGDVMLLDTDASRIFKVKTRGKFGNGPTMSCYFGGSTYMVLCNVKCSINIIPYSIYKGSLRI